MTHPIIAAAQKPPNFGLTDTNLLLTQDAGAALFVDDHGWTAAHYAAQLRNLSVRLFLLPQPDYSVPFRDPPRVSRRTTAHAAVNGANKCDSRPLERGGDWLDPVSASSRNGE